VAAPQAVVTDNRCGERDIVPGCCRHDGLEQRKPSPELQVAPAANSSPATPHPRQPSNQPLLPLAPLAITDEDRRRALRSTQIVRGEQCAEARLSRRGDRAAAWYCEKRSRAGRWPDRRAVMVAKRRRRRPQEHGWASHRAAAGVVAKEVRMPAVPSSPCPRPRPVSGVQCPLRASNVHACLSTRPVSGVRCGRLSVQAFGVRCPVWASGVHPFPRPMCPTGRSWRAAVGQAAAWLGWPGSACRPPYPRPARRLPESEPGDRGWRRQCWASGGVGLDLAVVVGGG
jgi:hypothetical protein